MISVVLLITGGLGLAPRDTHTHTHTHKKFSFDVLYEIYAQAHTRWYKYTYH